MNKQILLGHIHPFDLGYLYGKACRRWSRREAGEAIGFRNQDDEDLFMNGMDDGYVGDSSRLTNKKLA